MKSYLVKLFGPASAAASSFVSVVDAGLDDDEAGAAVFFPSISSRDLSISLSILLSALCLAFVFTLFRMPENWASAANGKAAINIAIMIFLFRSIILK